MNRSLLFAAALGFTSITVPAQVLFNYSWTTFNHDTAPSLSIPDANATGVTDIRTIVGDALQILKVTIGIEAAGNYNGDLYVTLQHGSAFSVLLNRPGRSVENSFGYSDPGFNVTFSDTAPSGDIHTAHNSVTPPGGTPLTGLWQPDARIVDPSVSLNSSQRTAFLSSFKGQNISGDWILFAADLSGGGQTQILSWNLQITTVPEPSQTALITATTLFTLAILRRRFMLQYRAE